MTNTYGLVRYDLDFHGLHGEDAFIGQDEKGRFVPFEQAVKRIKEMHDLFYDQHKELTQWQNNHSDVVKKLRIATQRPDLPVDRLPAIRKLQELIDENRKLTERNEELVRVNRSLATRTEELANALHEERESLKAFKARVASNISKLSDLTKPVKR